MACKTSFELHHHFPKLAEESGFTFNTHRPRIHIDWNKIRLIDLDSMIKERKFVIIEQHLNDILDCVFESEFDVRILDEGVMKMFRLAQLAVEYQQFCRHYLDRSVYVLREEINSLAKELDISKKDIKEKDDEIRRLRKRTRHSYKTPLPYGNDNIATMILKTLSQQKGEMFPSTSNDMIQYNKCNYCDKVFLNQLYLQSHITRRHADAIEVPQKENVKQENNENAKLSAEVTELRNKLKEMEIIIANSNNLANRSVTNEVKDNMKEDQTNKQQEITKFNMRDAEVATNNDDYLLNKIEEWKKEEHENYNKEMNKLRNQIVETINSIKDNEKKDTNKNPSLEPNIILQLHETIKQQGSEILSLRKELNDCKINTEKDVADRNLEAEAQISFLSKRAEAQSKQYELLLQKLNDVAQDAKESRALAEAEKERASQLQILLQQSLNSKPNTNNDNTDNILTPNRKPKHDNTKVKSIKKKTIPEKTEKEIDNKTLENLHRKAQELLNIDITSTSSESSSIETKTLATKSIDIIDKNGRNLKKDIISTPKIIEERYHEPKVIITENNIQKSSKSMKLNSKKGKQSNSIKANHIPKVTQGSPIKVVRAKITEEVNNRLVAAGVDPLKPRLPRSVFQKQRMHLHRQVELKSKKNPIHETTRHQILAYLDSNTNPKKDMTPSNEYISPTKISKPFKNLSSVISNVKTKALSLVKLNDTKVKRNSLNDEVAKRAMFLLKTPPGSVTSSPKASRRSPFKVFNASSNSSNNVSKANRKHKEIHDEVTLAKSPKHTQATIADASCSDDDSDQSDHKYYKTNNIQQSIQSLVKSPARRPASAAADYNNTVHKFTISDNNILRTQSAVDLNNLTPTTKYDNIKHIKSQDTIKSSEDESLSDDILQKNHYLDDHNVQNTLKQTKSVLKNASSTSSLNKKKVLFDMDAIQMKSVSASPSQSTTEKSDEKYELGLVNLEGEEWDISSIENEPLTNDTKIQNVVSRTSPKIAELKEKIESQLARRNDTPTVPLVGGVDVLAGSMVKAASITGSNTSLGSSILDDSESVPVVNHKTFVKPKKVTVKDDSDIDISEFSINGIVNKHESF